MSLPCARSSQNALHGRWENFWSCEQACVVRLVGREDVMNKLVYTAATIAGSPVTGRGRTRAERLGRYAWRSRSLDPRAPESGQLASSPSGYRSPRPRSGSHARQRAAQRRGLGPGRDKLHGRMVGRRSVVEMAPSAVVIRWCTDEHRDPDPRRQQACPRSPRALAGLSQLG